MRSDNLYVECIARSLDQGFPARAAVASEQVAGLLARAGVNGGAKVVDGSGLSRYSLVSAEALVQLSAYVWSRPYGADLEALLPLAGRDGTLSGRMMGTPAEGRVRAKSGSMSGSATSSGTSIPSPGTGCSSRCWSTASPHLRGRWLRFRIACWPF